MAGGSGFDIAFRHTSIMRNAKNESCLLSYVFDSHRDYLVSISQGVMQDICWLARDAHTMRRKSIKCMFLRTSDAPDETAQKFTVLVWHSVKEDDSDMLSFSRLLSRDTQVALEYGLPSTPTPGRSTFDSIFWDARHLPLARYEHTGCDIVLEIRRPDTPYSIAARDIEINAFDTFKDGKPLVGKGYLTFDVGEKVAERRVNVCFDAPREIPDEEEEAKRLLRLDLLPGRGFPSLLSPY